MRERQEGAVAERPKSEPKRAEDEKAAAKAKRVVQTAETEEQRKAKKEYLESILSPGVE